MDEATQMTVEARESQLPFGFRTNWDAGAQIRIGAAGVKTSQLPFGFRTNWDRMEEDAWRRNVLVSIAFRLSDELGLASKAGPSKAELEKSQLPFGFRTNWDNGRIYGENTAAIPMSQLPFGFRTNWDELFRIQDWVKERQSQLPFGFRTNWDIDVLYATTMVAAVASQLPFGFRTNWDSQEYRDFEERARKSQLPFGFRTNWDV